MVARSTVKHCGRKKQKQRLSLVNGMEDGKPIRATGGPVGVEDEPVLIHSATISKRDGIDLIRNYVGKGTTLDLLTGPAANRRPNKHVLQFQNVPIHNLIV